MLSVDIQAALSCCCLTLQQPGLWAHLATASHSSQACSLIRCVRLLIEAGWGHRRGNAAALQISWCLVREPQ